MNTEHEKAILDFLAGKSVQGKFADIVKLQRQDPFYHTVMYDLPQGQLSWLMRACVDCLPSYANLRRWNKVLSDKCALCDQRETLHHALNHCQTALSQERYNLRHNSVLLHILRQIEASKSHSGKRIYADLQGHSLPGGGTIPPEIYVTPKEPDLVLVDDEKKVIELFELTCCGDTEELIQGAQNRKLLRYQHIRDGINNDDASKFVHWETFRAMHVRLSDTL